MKFKVGDIVCHKDDASERKYTIKHIDRSSIWDCSVESNDKERLGFRVNNGMLILKEKCDYSIII